MGHRLSKIVTRTGDQGTTGLGDGSRVAKNHPRVEFFGTVDELNSTVGMVVAILPSELKQISDFLLQVQNDLFDLGGEACIPGMITIKESYIQRLETEIESLNAELPFLKEFILPGGHPAAATCHLARTICRRAERCLITLQEIEEINPQSLIYLNRLSDWLFIMSRTINRLLGCSEMLWKKII